MKTLTLVTALLSTILFTNVATAESEPTHYWYYPTAIESEVESSYTVQLSEDKSSCESSAIVTEQETDEDKQEALFTCIYEKGWKLSPTETMEDGYFIIDLCAFKAGKIVEASYFECRSLDALPFKMAYSTDFSEEKALDDAIRRYNLLRSGGSL